MAKTANALLVKGQPLDEAVIIPIMIHAIKEANDQVAKKEILGYVLDDFPRTRNQAQALEKELTGYEEPKVIKPGNLKRGLKPPTKDRRKSIIALNPGGDAEALPPVTVPSCIDVVFLLQVPNATAIERASGRRLDPLTGMIYHLQHSPPPKTEPVHNNTEH